MLEMLVLCLDIQGEDVIEHTYMAIVMCLHFNCKRKVFLSMYLDAKCHLCTL